MQTTIMNFDANLFCKNLALRSATLKYGVDLLKLFAQGSQRGSRGQNLVWRILPFVSTTSSGVCFLILDPLAFPQRAVYREWTSGTESDVRDSEACAFPRY